jgi:hypothetical protein
MSLTRMARGITLFGRDEAFKYFAMQQSSTRSKLENIRDHSITYEVEGQYEFLKLVEFWDAAPQ